MKHHFYCSVDLSQHKRGIVPCLLDDLKKAVKWFWTAVTEKAPEY